MMLEVIPLRYGTAFKKAFSDPMVFARFVRDVLGIEFQASVIEQEYAYKEPVGKVDVEYDLFAEDASRRIVVELQHVRENDSFDRFLYYHLIGMVEQISSYANYRFSRDVYTLVVLTRLPRDAALQFSVATCDLDPTDEQGRRLGVYRHRLVFLNARLVNEHTPPAIRVWLSLIEDSLDGQLDEAPFNDDEVFRRLIDRIRTDRISPHEAFLLKEEAVWEDTRRQERETGEARGEARGLREGEAKGLRQAIEDLCELQGIELTVDRKATLTSLDLDGLTTLRAAIKLRKRWP